MKNAKKIAGLMIGLLALVSLTTGAFAQQKFSTTIYFDYTFNLTNDGYLTNTNLNPAPITNQFRFRRAYFRYENKISDVLSFRLTYDADNTANITGATLGGTPPAIATKKDDKLRPFIKHLWLDYSGLLPASSLRIGMVNTLTFQIAEDKWGYRSVAKTMADIYKDITGADIRVSSADLGFNFTEMPMKELRWGVSIVSGEGYSHPEYDKFKKYAGYIDLIPLSGLSFFGYIDSEARPIAATATTPASSGTATTYKGDVYFEMIPNLTLAGEYLSYNSELNKNSDKSHFNSNGYSIWGVYKIIVDYLNAFVRYDHFMPNSTVSTKNQDLTIIGLDWAPVSTTWKLQPNVLIQGYADATKKTDVIAQMTFFLSF